MSVRRNLVRAVLGLALFVPLMTVGVHDGRAAQGKLQVAIFAGGCFWCVESDFDKVRGVKATISGYIGGRVKNPTYKQVAAGGTGHREAVKILYDPKQVSYEKLLHIYWRSIDPTDGGGQFCDRGSSYTTAIFATSQRQHRLAKESKEKLQRSGVLGAPIVTRILTAGRFYRAEGYHQNYYRKKPGQYRLYRSGCGRDARIRELWGSQAHGGIGHGR